MHLAAIGKKSKLGQWILHKLTNCDHKHCAEMCTLLLLYKCTNGWLHSVIIINESECSMSTTNADASGSTLTSSHSQSRMMTRAPKSHVVHLGQRARCDLLQTALTQCQHRHHLLLRSAAAAHWQALRSESRASSCTSSLAARLLVPKITQQKLLDLGLGCYYKAHRCCITWSHFVCKKHSTMMKHFSCVRCLKNVDAGESD